MTSPEPSDPLWKEFEERCYRISLRRGERVFTVQGDGGFVLYASVHYMTSKSIPGVRLDVNATVQSPRHSYMCRGHDGEWCRENVERIALPILRKHMVLDDLANA